MKKKHMSFVQFMELFRPELKPGYKEGDVRALARSKNIKIDNLHNIIDDFRQDLRGHSRKYRGIK